MQSSRLLLKNKLSNKNGWLLSSHYSLIRQRLIFNSNLSLCSMTGMNRFRINSSIKEYTYYPLTFQVYKRGVQLPPYHPKYKKPEWAWDLELDPKIYSGFWKIFPVNPKSRPAVYVFTFVMMAEFVCIAICHHWMLSD